MAENAAAHNSIVLFCRYVPSIRISDLVLEHAYHFVERAALTQSNLVERWSFSKAGVFLSYGLVW